MEIASTKLRWLLTLLVLGNGIVLVTQSRHSSQPELSNPPAQIAPVDGSHSAPVRDGFDPRLHLFSLNKSIQPAVESGNPR
jgi:hypothetical protein